MDLQKYYPVNSNVHAINGSELGLVILVETQCRIILTDVLPGFYAYVRRRGAGAVTFTAADGQTINSQLGLLSISDRYCTVTIDHESATVWSLCGALA